MTHPGFVVLAGLWLSVAAAAERAREGYPARERVGRLILQLASDRFADRERAARELEAVGEPALPALQTASRSDDAEVRRRSAALAVKIGRRVEAARLLAPQRVRLVYQDVPLTEAVADLVKQTRFPVQVHGDSSALAGRKITLDTGDVSAWEAFDRFCSKAGLVESALVNPRLPPQPAAANEELRRRLEIERLGQRTGDARNRCFQPFVLVAGRPLDLPACYAGAVRIRALPANLLPAAQAAAGEAVVGLEINAEPRLQWQRVISVDIDRALDDQGRLVEHKELLAAAGPQAGAQVLAGGVVVMTDSPVSPHWVGHAGLVPLHLKQLRPPARAIKELRGNIAAQVQTPRQKLLTVGGLLKAGGKTFDGPDGLSVKVLEAAEANGQARLRVQVTTSNQLAPVGANGRLIRRVRVVAGAGMVETVQGGASDDFQIQDAAGHALPVVAQQVMTTGNGFSQTQELTLSCQLNGSAAARLVVNGPRTVLVNVPFTLKDVPLSPRP